VARSNLVEQLKPSGARQRRPPPHDQWLLPMVRAIPAEHASYGYRRVTALLNRQLQAESCARANHKRNVPNHADQSAAAAALPRPNRKCWLATTKPRYGKAELPTTPRFHDLRHSTATLLLAQGVHPRAIMELRAYLHHRDHEHPRSCALREDARRRIKWSNTRPVVRRYSNLEAQISSGTPPCGCQMWLSTMALIGKFLGDPSGSRTRVPGRER
jgi:hypothetical protein